MNFVGFIMPKIHFINYLKRISILNYESKILNVVSILFLTFKFSPLGSIDPLYSNMNAIYVELVEDSLTEFVYPAQLGGLQYELSALNYGIQVY